MGATHDMLRTLFTMATAVEARDPYTGGHLWRVSQFSHLLAEEAGLSTEEQARVALGGFLHDLGKIGVPDAILNKPEKLTDEEYAVIKTHPGIGQRLLQSHPLAGLVIEAVHAHHERPDGRGYPRSLSAEGISIDARIVSICDAFDAMTSSRPYRRGMPIDKALAIIRENLGTQFDRKLGERFISLGERGELAHVVGHSEPGIPLQNCPNCGPTIVVSREQKPGDHVYCRVCGSEAKLVRGGQGLGIESTGFKGGPDDLAPVADEALIERLLGNAQRLLASRRLPLLRRVYVRLFGQDD
ncbi:MAG: HD-GYP domain-containing protein [Chromatiales bacterium]|nr:HD-GYP domain-containing protein [Gammaproteobacteria bacterium]MBW6475820.1 HD-GYP domain-containing protein [Chromatiales bacterium]